MANLVGTNASQVINGTSDNDTINGLGGNDSLRGGDGDDIYLFTGAFGADQVRDTSGIDQIRFTGEFSPQDFRMFRQFSDLVLERVGAIGDSVRLDGFFSGSASIEFIVFERNGATFDLRGPAFISLGLTGTSGAEILTGSPFDDVIRGLGGNDSLRGSDGNDIYGFSGAFGADSVLDTSGTDQIRIGADYSERDFRLVTSFSDLVIQQINGGNSIRLENYFTQTGTGIESVLFERTGGILQLGGANPTFVPGFFSYEGYLSAYADVRAAGVDAYQHYAQFGWREGRDPSALFDTQVYLLRNPDVAAAGINPLQHYLFFGRGEGRQASPSVNPSSDGFDATYYLLSSPDVGFAGLNPRAHYDQFGAREGRDPNGFFDSRFYLLSNPDVANAGLNPLAHYNANGWREGRDPSARFDTSSYLAANPDVAAAGVNPLVHYLNAGIYEGRSLGDGIMG